MVKINNLEKTNKPIKANRPPTKLNKTTKPKIIGDQCSYSNIIRQVIKDRNGDEDKGFIAIKQIIKRKLRKSYYEENEENISRKGVFILLRSIKYKLNKLQANLNRKNYMIEKRIEWFTSKECKNILIRKILDDNFDSYTDFFKRFFNIDQFQNSTLDTYNIKFRGKDSGMERVNANDQCKIVIGDKSSLDIDSRCYICNHSFYNKRNHDFHQIDCEHILPIESAISHISILQDKRAEYDDYLEKEYSWAHKCCNLQKGNIDVVKYTLEGWQVDRSAIKQILKNISNSNSTGCATINNYGPVFTRDNVNRITSKVEPLVDIINKNVNLIGGNYYRLYLLFKLISSFDDDFFDSILRGESPYSGGGDNDNLEDVFDPNNDEFNEILLQEINDVADEIIENPEELKPTYVKRQRVTYQDDGNKIITNRFYPYDSFQKFTFESKYNNGIMPEYKPIKTYFSDDNIRSEFPGEGNPYGTFNDIDIENLQTKRGGKYRNKTSHKTKRKVNKRIIKTKFKKNRKYVKKTRRII